MKKAIFICAAALSLTMAAAPPTAYVDVLCGDNYAITTSGNLVNIDYPTDNSANSYWRLGSGSITSIAATKDVQLVTLNGHLTDPAKVYKYIKQGYECTELTLDPSANNACSLRLFQDIIDTDHILVSCYGWDGSVSTIISSDFGNTWDVSNLTAPIFAMAFNEKDISVGYCVTLTEGNEMQIYRTDDGGKWWNEIITLPYRYTLNQIRNAGHRIHIDTCPVDANKVVITCHTPFVLDAETKQLGYIKCEDSSATMTVRKYGFAHNSDRLITFSAEAPSLLLASDDLFETCTEYSYQQWNSPVNTLGYTDGWTRKGKNIYYHKAQINTIGIIPLDEMFASVESIEGGDVQISATDGTITVSSPTATDISLTTVDGKSIYSSHTAETSVKVTPGIYIVTVGKSTFKVSCD